MNIIEPGIRNLALAKDILLTPYGLDESLLTRTIADIFTHRVDYADLYFQATRSEAWSLEEGIVKSGSFSIDQGVGVSVFSPLARGLLTCEPQSTRNQTDFFTAQMYGDASSLAIAESVAKVAKRRDVPPAQIAQAWVLSRPGVASMLVGADSVEQFDSALGALETQLTEDELYELERNYTPCDLINDYTAGKRIARTPRPAQGSFAVD